MVWSADYIPDSSSWQWRLLAPPTSSKENDTSETFPPTRVAHSQACVNENVYIFGGRKGINMNESPLNDLWKFHAPTERWSRVIFSSDDDDASSNIPEERSFHKMIAVGTDLYVFGGCGASGRLADLHKFDTIAGRWQKLEASTLLKGRGGPNLLSLRKSSGEGYLAVVAGFVGEESRDGHVYGLPRKEKEDGAWEEDVMGGLEELRPRSVCVAASFSELNVGLIFGGEVNPSDRGHEGAGGFTNDVILMDGNTARISKTMNAPEEGEWPEPRGWAEGAVGEGNSLYLFGGLTGDDKDPTRLDDLWRCDLRLQD